MPAPVSDAPVGASISSRIKSLRATVRSFVLRQLRLALGLGLLSVLAINYGARAGGGTVHPLSLSRIDDRARALAAYAGHRPLCSCPSEPTAVEAALRRAAQRHGVSERLVRSVARAESGLIHTRISGTGAMGVMQLMPGTARELGLTDPFDLAQNVDGGVRYIKQMLGVYKGNVRRALAAYNAGPGRIPKRGPLTMPGATRHYVARVIAGM
ncbi:MAG: lytic transglycosylase domain-containing protein [Polyangiales bacterium]